MANYIVPQTLVFQDFNLIPQAAQRPLRAHIAGGHAFLVRYSVAGEKENGLLGYYDAQTDRCYPWPAVPVGAVLDATYTKVFVENALLQYFHDPANFSEVIKTVPGAPNRVKATSLKFVANGEEYPRSVAVFPERDVQVGDVAQVRAVVGGEEYVLWTQVAGFAGEAVAAVVDDATASSENAANNATPDISATQIAGPINCVDIVDVDPADYDGSASGCLTETYRLRVIRSSVGGVLSTARICVVSASGLDDVAEVSPDEDGVLAVGSRGLVVTFGESLSADCSFSASLSGVSAGELLVGQEWEVTVAQAWSKPAVTSGGSYVGSQDCTYVITVHEGGLWGKGALPKIRVTTDTGFDMSGTVTVSGSGVAVAIGAYGVTLTFTGNGLRKGDVYYVPVTAATVGDIKTLIFTNNLPVPVVQASENEGIEVELSLYIRKPFVEISSQRILANIYNWEQSETELCIKAGATAYDASWTVGGVAQPLPVVSSDTKGYGKLYVEYRAWLPAFSDDVYSVQDIGSLNTYVAGPLHPDNPLKWGLYKALQNNNGVEVKFTSVANPAILDSWLAVLALLEDRDDVFGLVPLTRDVSVLNAYQAHVASASTPERGRWRVAWFNAEGPTKTAVVDAATSSDQQPVLATIADDPNTSGNQYTIVTVAPSGASPNGQFITNGVRSGDVLRVNYALDGYGNATYEEYVVASVLSEDSLRLASGPSSPISETPRKIEIWRNMTAQDIATHVSRTAGAWGSKWVRYVWPDTIEGDGATMPGYYLCAALAALSGGVAPHQGLTRLAIAGFTGVPRTTRLFNRAQLDLMASAGTWIVTQNSRGDIFTRHAITAGNQEDATERDEMFVRNTASVSYYIFDVLDPFIGVANVTPRMADELRSYLFTGLASLRDTQYIARLGPQIIGFEILEIRPHVVLVNRMVVVVRFQFPFALDNIEMHMVL